MPLRVTLALVSLYPGLVVRADAVSTAVEPLLKAVGGADNCGTDLSFPITRAELGRQGKQDQDARVHRLRLRCRHRPSFSTRAAAQPMSAAMSPIRTMSSSSKREGK